MHQTMGIVLKALLILWPPQTPQDVLHLEHNGLATLMNLMQSTISTILKASPGALMFSHDMLLNVPLIAELQTIACNREALVNKDLLKSNQQHINHDYFVGQLVLKYDQTMNRKITVKSLTPL